MAVNADFNGDRVAITPEFVGVEPQTFTSGGVTYTPMSGEKTAVFNLLGSLDSTQLANAKLSGSFSDVVKGAGTDATAYPSNAGVLVSSLSTAQQALVTEVIKQWANDFPADVADDYLAAYTSESAYSQTYVGWGNTTDSTGRAYLRISGPRAWIEYIRPERHRVPEPGPHPHRLPRQVFRLHHRHVHLDHVHLDPQDHLGKGFLRTSRQGEGERRSSGTTPTGTVTVYDRKKAVAEGTLTGGTATIKLPATLAVGKHKLHAVYTGSSTVSGSTSDAVTLTVRQGTSRVRATLASRTGTGHQHAKVKVQVAPAAGRPTGKVTVTVDGHRVKTAALKAKMRGKVKITLPSLTDGTRVVKVTYSGSKNLTGSTSPARRVRVTG